MIFPSLKSSSLKSLFIGFLRRYGTVKIKQKIWNAEYGKGRWLIPLGTDRSDILYCVIERYLNGRDILDLGCGNGRFLRLKADRGSGLAIQQRRRKHFVIRGLRTARKHGTVE
jgi:SAM-dependent methyltransferase